MKIGLQEKIIYYSYKALFYFAGSMVSYFFWDAIRNMIGIK